MSRSLLAGLAAGALAFAVGLSDGDARAEWRTVTFDSAILPPTPFAQRHLELQGRDWTPPPATPIIGYLALPEGEGPAPAVVLLPDCDGLLPTRLEPPYDFTARGYAVLWVDSLRSRGFAEVCKSLYKPTASAVALDAHGALAYLAEHPRVDAARVALVGWGFGANAALVAVGRGGIAAPLATRFAGAVAVSPFCAYDGDFLVPTLLLLGGADELAPLRLCRFMQRRRPVAAPLFDLVVFPEAEHGFDDRRWVTPGERDVGWTRQRLAYDPAAHAAASERIFDYLARRFAAPPG